MAENYHINLIIMIFTAANNYNYAKLFNNYCLLAINRNIMSFTTLIVRFMRIMCTARWLVIVADLDAWQTRNENGREKNKVEKHDYVDYLSRITFLHP